MRRIAYLGAALLLVGGLAWLVQSHFTALAEESAEKVAHGYIGAKSCKACHSKAAKGEQFVKWEAGPHAQAYNTLLTDAAKAVAAKAGIEGAPEASDECLKCHVTGHGAKAELLGKKYDMTEGVGCESCHGAAADWKVVHMKDVPGAMEKGMLAAGEETCAACHNETSPTFKPFEYAKMFPKIAHANPEKAAAQ